MMERLLLTLSRSDIDRPKVLNEKYDIFRKYEDQLKDIPEVKRAMRAELKRRKNQ